jgi:hypothetical protein
MQRGLAELQRCIAVKLRRIAAQLRCVSGAFLRQCELIAPSAGLREPVTALLDGVAGLLKAANALLPHVAGALSGRTALLPGLSALQRNVAAQQ